jgi:hypothetical protein
VKKLLAALLVLGTAAANAPAAEKEAIDRAVSRGVEALQRMQQADGTWRHLEARRSLELGNLAVTGPTALAALTLLECGVAPGDRAIQRAADVVRQASVNLTYTYSISLAILFLDRLADPADVPLIESLTVRLLAGQVPSGGWGYHCPAIAEGEVRRLMESVRQRKELVGGRELPRPGGRRTVKDLPKEIQQQLAMLNRGMIGPQETGSDNSNTQFATLALWVGRRQGLPVDKALARVESRFRTTQKADGGWSYFDPSMTGRGPPEFNASTASMTCAGLLCLAIGHGAMLESARQKGPDARPHDLNKDPVVRQGLLALSAVIDQPQGRRAGAAGRPQVPQVGGKTFYFLWTLERLAVALDLETIGKKDWYGWGAEILLANQQADGSWQGEYAASGADTCFALLFLKRVNLARDLSGQLKGIVKDEAVLRAGGIGGGGLQRGVGGNVKPGIDAKGPAEVARAAPAPDNTPPPVKALAPPPPPVPPPPNTVQPTPVSARLAADLVRATGSREAETLKELRDGKGVMFTEALLQAIPQLKGDRQQKARQALAQRLTRMKPDTLAKYLEDEDPEIRRAAATACALKECRELIPKLITRLRDRDLRVVGAAHTALKDLAGEDFGPKPGADREDRNEAAARWLEWWNKQGK